MNEPIIKLLERHSAGFHFKHCAATDVPSKARPSMFAGWVVSIRGTWYFMTAGHAVAALQGLKENNAIITDCFFDHSLNLGAKTPQPVPLAFKDLSFFQMYNKEANIDFGLILIPNGQRVLLSQQAISPVNETIWDGIDTIEFEKDAFYLAGIHNTRLGSGKHPLTALKVEETDGAGGDTFTGSLPERPAEMKEPLNGGAIFGFNKARDKYWMVALLSQPPDADGRLEGCYLQPFIRLIEDQMEVVKKQHKK